MATAIIENGNYKVDSLHQWDLNQTLVIRGMSLASIPEVHFANRRMGMAIVRQASMDAAGVVTVEVPNSILQQPQDIRVYVCVYEGKTFLTKYKLEIPVVPRSCPEDYTLTDDPEVYSFNALANQVTNAVATLNAAVSKVDTRYNAAASNLESAVSTYNGATALVEAAVADAVDTASAALMDNLAPRLASVSLPAASWTQDEAGYYKQAVTITGGTAMDLVTLQLTAAQIDALNEAKVTYLLVENDAGTFTAIAGGAKPEADLTVQATLEEVKS